jgi:hypothetical protein
MSEAGLSGRQSAQIDDFVGSSEGLRLIGAFMLVHNADLRRKIVMLVQEIAGDDGKWKPKRTGTVDRFAPKRPQG